MNPETINRLLFKASKGLLDTTEQQELANEFVFYRDAALRLEVAIHSLTKEIEAMTDER